jgi:hypothetical protein
MHLNTISSSNSSSTAMSGPWPPQTNVASDLYPGHPPANFYNSVSLRQFFFTNRLIFKISKFKLYWSIIRPTVTDGCETRGLKRTIKKQVNGI